MNETNTLHDFRAKFRVDELKVIDCGTWSWSVRPNQPTLGAGIISLKRFAPRLSEVAAKEMAELAHLVSALERATRRAFDYNIMNYLMLMMVDHHVHYHVIPRYDGPRQFADLEWMDSGWPALPVMGNSQHQDQQRALEHIRDALIAASAP